MTKWILTDYLENSTKVVHSPIYASEYVVVKLKEATEEEDIALQKVKHYIYNGWPELKKATDS